MSITLSGLPDASIVRLCLKNGQRLVLINRDDDEPGPLKTNLDDFEAGERIVTAFARRAASHLPRQLRCRDTKPGWGERGFVAAATRLGLEVSVERHGWTGYEAGRGSGATTTRPAGRMPSSARPIFLLAASWMPRQSSVGISIPDQMGSRVLDTSSRCRLSYDLTTFAQPVAEIAARAVASAVDRREWQ